MPTGFPPSSFARRASFFSRLDPIQRKQLLTRVSAAAALLLAGFLLGAYFGKNLFNRGLPITVSNVPEVNRLLQKVSRHFAINPTENPTFATVQDPLTLRGQDPVFFKDAAVGDKMIVWSDRAVLYSVKKDLILAAVVAPNLQAPWAPLLNQAQLQAKDIIIEVRNGSGQAGLGQTIADRIKEKGLTVSAVKDAKKTLSDTLVIAVSDKVKGLDMQPFAAFIGGKVGTLPEGEPAPTGVDILVILGASQK
ncbi:LytR family transcriptional regulator [Patescibacteria group bacterium]|nr:MAG: LytR family transcriptional regulator [Patescibacteria group bacterium]